MIRADGLFFSYTGDAPFILRDIDLDIKSGEYVSVVGDNGSGKTTLMRLILKLIKPTRGSVSNGAERVGYVPQRSGFTYSGFPLTVREMLISYGKLLRVDTKSDIDAVLELTGMTDYKKSLVGSLSGGQSQKTLIARALIGAPQLLVLDEPSTGIDLPSQTEIYGILRRLNRENGITIVSVEHNLKAAMSNSTLIYHLASGHGHICTPEQYAKEYLGGASDAEI
jgi:zinc transport system ATP-binding protein